MKMLKKICVLAVFSLLFAAQLMAQSAESATTGITRLLVGGEVSSFNPDWGCTSSSAFKCWDNHLLGLGAIADLNHVYRGLGVEAEARWLQWQGPGGGLVESNYLVGPRYPLYRKGSFAFYAKGLVGKSWITRSYNLGKGSYFTLAPGGTVEYGITRKVLVRLGYEYQIWPNFEGLPGQGVNGLTPNGFSLGFSYRL